VDLTIGLTALGLLLGGVACWVQINSYRLQKRQGTGPPGQQVDPGEAAEVLSDVDEDLVRAIAADHIFVEAEERGVGYIDKQPICVYLDLHTASCDPAKRAALSRSLAAFIRAELGASGKGALIASPREGNLLVGAGTAELLKTRFLMVRTVTAPRFGYPIEGIFNAGSNVVLVDDLCMEGTFLKRCVRNLRRYGLNISDCVCLFERVDGDAREALASVKVNLHSRYLIDDQELRELRQSAVVADRRERLT